MGRKQKHKSSSDKPHNWLSSNIVKVGGFAITAFLSSQLLNTWCQGVREDRQKRENLEEEISNLVDNIKLTEILVEAIALPTGSSIQDKFNFLRTSQKLFHSTEWAKVEESTAIYQDSLSTSEVRKIYNTHHVLEKTIRESALIVIPYLEANHLHLTFYRKKKSKELSSEKMKPKRLLVTILCTVLQS
ncbi:MAG: hypothetical protein EOP48_02785 [Sphingobacteriales bacterium]|nr:MAG: hypothetical protein EOP48_02785 [Sphingobacteriales bacterium]